MMNHKVAEGRFPPEGPDYMKVQRRECMVHLTMRKKMRVEILARVKL